jgi:hypothetical protein
MNEVDEIHEQLRAICRSLFPDATFQAAPPHLVAALRKKLARFASGPNERGDRDSHVVEATDGRTWELRYTPKNAARGGVPFQATDLDTGEALFFKIPARRLMTAKGVTSVLRKHGIYPTVDVRPGVIFSLFKRG